MEEHNSRVVISNSDIQLIYNSMPNLNTWTEKDVESATMNEVQEVSKLEEFFEHVPHTNQLSMDGAGLSNFKPKSTWTRFNRMEFGLGGLACAITFPSLGKRDMRDDVGEQVDENEHKRGKVVNEGGVSEDLSTGVDSYPCQKQ